MTPQEKAVELYQLFLRYTPVEFEHEYTIKCAIVCVDEIINTDMLIDEDTYVEKPSYLHYWNEVKQEINKL